MFSLSNYITTCFQIIIIFIAYIINFVLKNIMLVVDGNDTHAAIWKVLVIKQFNVIKASLITCTTLKPYAHHMTLSIFYHNDLEHAWNSNIIKWDSIK